MGSRPRDLQLAQDEARTLSLIPKRVTQITNVPFYFE